MGSNYWAWRTSRVWACPNFEWQQPTSPRRAPPQFFLAWGGGIILDILCICFLSVFSTEMSSLWRQELGFAHCSTPSHDTQLLLKCLLNERRNFFMGSFALAGHQCLSEEKTLWELVRGNLYEGILRRKWLLVSTAMKKWFQGLATEYKLFKREDH